MRSSEGIRALALALAATAWLAAAAPAQLGDATPAAAGAASEPPTEARSEGDTNIGASPDPAGAAATGVARTNPSRPALDRWTLRSTDAAEGAAVVEDPDGVLRVVRKGEELESFRIASVHDARLVLRPVRPEEAVDVREVWLLLGPGRGGERLRWLRTRAELGAASLGPGRSEPGSKAISGEAVPKKTGDGGAP